MVLLFFGVVFFICILLFFFLVVLFVCLFVKGANELLVIGISGFITLPRMLGTGLLSRFWTEYTVGSACIESNVLYRERRFWSKATIFVC